MKNIFLKYLVNKYQVISFDVFDTLIERKVRLPSDIFRITGEQVLGTNSAESFTKDRINAESLARKLSDNGEVNLNDIYSLLQEEYREKARILKDTEIKNEIELCIPKEKIIQYFNYAISGNKEVYIISDMYLSTDIIEAMLEKCDVSGYKRIYVSNEFGVNKITGKLFDYVINENKVNSKEMLHIGDSIKADYLGARKAGIHGALIGRKHRISRLIKNAKKST